MKDTNRVWLSGTVSNQPSLQTLSSGTPLCIFTLGVCERWIDRNGQNKKRTNFIQVEVLGKNADQCYTLLQLNSRCEVNGYLRQDVINNESKTRIRTYSVDILDSLDGGDEEN